MGFSWTAGTQSPVGLAKTKTETEWGGSSLTIGLIPEQNIFKQLKRYQPLANYISKKIGFIIKVKVLARYGNIVDNFVSEGMDAAFFGSFTYTLAHSKLDVEVIARPEYIDGTSSYHGLILVRKDSGIRGAKDMEGKTFSFVDRATTAGYLFPMAYFKKNGIKDYNKFLSESYFSGTHADTIYDVLNKKADIGAAKNTVFARLEAADNRIKEELLVLEKSVDVPENGLAVRKDLAQSVKNNLKDTLLNMHNDDEGAEILRKFGARRFIETANDDYDGVYQLVEQIGMKLPIYHYWNE
jgi:phosphonate transport system substrate-binding protein